MHYYLKLNETEPVEDNLKFETGENHSIGTFVSVETESRELVDLYTVYVYAETVNKPFIKNTQMYTMDVLLLEPPSLTNDTNIPPKFIDIPNDWIFQKDDDGNEYIDENSLQQQRSIYTLPEIMDPNDDSYQISIFLGDLSDMIAYNEQHQ